MKKWTLGVCAMLALLFVFASTASAQTPAPVKNPTAVEWNCPDHDLDTEHELTIVQITGTNRITITTLLLGDPAYVDAATKLVRSPINVQPIKFGDYVARIVALEGTNRSEESPDSNTFTRAPGSPSKVLFK